MAEHKSTHTINARKKAVGSAKAFRERERRLRLLVEDYFKIFENNGSAAIEKKIEDYNEKIEQLKTQLAQIEKKTQREQAAVIARFKKEGVTDSEIVSRLGLSTSDIRPLSKLKDIPESMHKTEEDK